MEIAEGISVIISQHNGGTPTFEQLWASEDERRKLDIYYREAISDLEKHLIEWVASSSSQFPLSGSAADYSLQLKTGQFWPVRLSGLLRNKVQDYMVHSITAGWLHDFDGVTSKEDYAEMAAEDLTNIRFIVEQREFQDDTSARGNDAAKATDVSTPVAGARTTDAIKPSDVSAVEAGARTTDDIKPTDVSAVEASERTTDDIKPTDVSAVEASERTTDAIKPSDVSTVEASERTTDDIKPTDVSAVEASERVADTIKPTDVSTVTAGSRGTDIYKATDKTTVEAGKRHTDLTAKDVGTGVAGKYGERGADDVRKNDVYFKRSTMAHPRHRDDAPVHIGHDITDWSGVGAPFMPGELTTKEQMMMYAKIAHDHTRCCPPPPPPPPPPAPKPTDRYWPRKDEPWLGQLEEMSHQVQEQKNRDHDRRMAKFGPGIFMEKYRELHDERFMQQHQCGSRDQCDLDWDEETQF